MTDFPNISVEYEQPISIVLTLVLCISVFAMLGSIIRKILRKQNVHPIQLIVCVVLIVVLVCLVYISFQFGQSHPIADPNYPI